MINAMLTYCFSDVYKLHIIERRWLGVLQNLKSDIVRIELTVAAVLALNLIVYVFATYSVMVSELVSKCQKLVK